MPPRTALLPAVALAASVALAALPSFAHAYRTGDHEEPPEPPHGWYWGTVDANIDWCERNYVTSSYIAEFWNALSSIPIFLFALFGAVAGRRYAKAETRFTLGFCLMMVVGIGSFLFHATLRRYAQCADELPMLWASITLFYNVLDHEPSGVEAHRHQWHANASRLGVHRPPPKNPAKSIPCCPLHSCTYRLPLKLALITAGLVLTGIYFYLPGLFIIFFIGYSTFLMSFVGLMGYHILYGSRSARRQAALASQGYEGAGSAVEQEQLVGGGPGGDGGHRSHANAPRLNSDLSAPSPALTKPYTPVLGRLYYLALAGYFGGFVFWLYENTFCSTLPGWMQLHALWHLMAGVGTFAAIQCQLAWRGEERGGRTSLDNSVAGPLLPIVVIKYDEREA